MKRTLPAVLVVMALTLAVAGMGTRCSEAKPAKRSGITRIDAKLLTPSAILALRRLEVKDLIAMRAAGHTVRVLCYKGTNHKHLPGVEDFDYYMDVENFHFRASDYIVTVCDCPHEHSAAAMASFLNAKGFKNSFPVVGGFKSIEAFNRAVRPPS